MTDNAKNDAGTALGDSDPRSLIQALAHFASRPMGGASFAILITIVPLILLWVLMWIALDVGYGLYLLLAVPAAGFLVRLFMIQHDCGHGAFFLHPRGQRLGRTRLGRPHVHPL